MQLVDQLEVRRFAIDEAHCISHWGHDFRPEYRQMAVLRKRFSSASFHAFTATATPRVQGDIVTQLGLRDPAILIGCFDRPNLIYRIVPLVDRDAQALEVVRRHPNEAVIVYCISRRETESMAGDAARTTAFGPQPYHAGLSPEDRHRTQESIRRRAARRGRGHGGVRHGHRSEQCALRAACLDAEIGRALSAGNGPRRAAMAWRPNACCSIRRPTRCAGNR